MAIEYDVDEGIGEVAFRIAGTVIPEVVAAPEFWVLLILNISVRGSRALDLFHPSDLNIDLPWGLTGITSSLMTFFVCFYNGQQFGRYNHIYDVTQDMFEQAIRFASLAKLQVKHEDVQKKTAKLIVASIFIFLTFQRVHRVSPMTWRLLAQLELLSVEEILVLRKHIRSLESDAMPSFLPLNWAASLVYQVTENHPDHEDMLASFMSVIRSLRASQAEVVHLLELPMPFQYFHIMNMMLVLNLTLWAYSLGCEDTYFAPIIYLVAQMIFQGLRELSTSLADPFGDDDVDFPVDAWMKQFYSRIYGIVEDDFDITKIDKSLAKSMLPPQEFHAIYVRQS